MEVKIIFRILKAIFFTIALLFYGLFSEVKLIGDFLFALVLAIYLISLYKEGKNE